MQTTSGTPAPTRRAGLAVTSLVILAVLAPCTSRAAASTGATATGPGLGSRYRATIRWTAGKVPNISGATLEDVTFGQGWASGATRPCDLLDSIIKLRSERSRWFGPGANDANITSDVGWRAIGITAIAARDWPNASARVRSSMIAFAAGWNAHLAQVGSSGLPGWCAGADWVRRVKPAEVYLAARGVALFASSSQVVEYVAGAEPPAGRTAASPSGTPTDWGDVSFEPRTGSNGWAIGSDRTAASGGVQGRTVAGRCS